MLNGVGEAMLVDALLIAAVLVYMLVKHPRGLARFVLGAVRLLSLAWLLSMLGGRRD